MKNVLLACLMGLLLISCSKDDEEVDYAAIDDEKIQTYLADNNLSDITKKHSSGLYYQIVTPGTGDYTAPPGSRITVRYTGTFLDGEVFDSGRLDNYPLSSLIDAWKIGIPMLKEGGEAMLYCPSHLAYGTKGSGSIPPNTPLIFEVKLIDFQ
ncbi:FKBP-type peptidyl-prolyl cis-trans isomerase [Carboxylicivirga sp. M1479]|uniref:FKBP-type peptidyl-prolyl cis-trans isomerase n=1 Tax=Carboxylicivirga sp. M1479 TaxID=2594476 RepID=UPI00117757CC|nr:FKBP-type peptidyl-prolyl cis-trans isomerase [Carboxylicivirga sp. M1479]TRX71376.1 peptidylprolyl isomerase [Carboxylicivirga sp. M1479]